MTATDDRFRPSDQTDARAKAERGGCGCDRRAPSQPSWLGLEHEFLVFDEAGARLDFRSQIHDLGLGRRDLVPHDRYAYRLPTGSMITADTNEAEIAVPPVTLAPGFTDRVEKWAAYERDRLAAVVAPLRLKGDSTHFSLTMPSDVDPDHVADLFARRFAPGLMLLMDRRHSPGLLVRPRPFRLELGGEYVVGAALRAAAAYAAGGALACFTAARRHDLSGLPPALEVSLERGTLRYGWYVSRTAFGGDLYLTGRSTPLTGHDGDSWLASDHMALCWNIARARLQPFANAADLRAADAAVSGEMRLPVEQADPADDGSPSKVRRPRSAFGSVLSPRRRRHFEMAAVMVTWQSAVFLVARRDRGRIAYLVVPGAALEHFVAALDGGLLDRPIEDYLALDPSGRWLRSTHQAAQPGMFNSLGLRASLLAPERDYWGRVVRLTSRPAAPVRQPAGSAS